MVFQEITNVPIELITEVGKIGLWMQTIGVIVVLWIIFQLVFLWFNAKRMEEVHLIKEEMKRIEGKIDRILKKR